MKWDLISAYGVARGVVIREGYAAEIAWQESRTPNQITEQEFLKQYAWVVLSSGMKESVIRSRFSEVEQAFMDFCSSHLIVNNESLCRRLSLMAFGHERKIAAIIRTTKWVSDIGIWSVVAGLKSEGAAYLMQLPYMGPATSLHLAKNLGLDVVKPDRHLMRMAEATGYRTANGLCRYISDHVCEKVSVVDTVLWRYATIDPKYLELFMQGFFPARQFSTRGTSPDITAL